MYVYVYDISAKELGDKPTYWIFDCDKCMIKRMSEDLQVPKRRAGRNPDNLYHPTFHSVAKHQSFFFKLRFRRDVLEGTLEEMLEPEIVEKDDEEEAIPERWIH